MWICSKHTFQILHTLHWSYICCTWNRYCFPMHQDIYWISRPGTCESSWSSWVWGRMWEKMGTKYLTKICLNEIHGIHLISFDFNSSFRNVSSIEMCSTRVLWIWHLPWGSQKWRYLEKPSFFHSGFWTTKTLTSMDLFKVQMLSDANGGYVQWSLGWGKKHSETDKSKSHRCIWRVWQLRFCFRVKQMKVGMCNAQRWKLWRWRSVGQTANFTANISYCSQTKALYFSLGKSHQTWKSFCSLVVMDWRSDWNAVSVWQSVSFGQLQSCQNLGNPKEEGCQPVLFSKRRMEECGIAWTREGCGVVSFCERTGPASTQNHIQHEGYQNNQGLTSLQDVFHIFFAIILTNLEDHTIAGADVAYYPCSASACILQSEVNHNWPHGRMIRLCPVFLFWLLF